jgi:hypothetical protein
MKEQGKDSKRRGQTTVEYILLLGVIAGVFAVVQKYLEPGVVKNVGALVGMARNEAAVGGQVSADPEKTHSAYYSKGQMKVQ